MAAAKKSSFILPIEFSPYRQKLFNNLYEDLELLKTIDPSGTPILQSTFKPKTAMGQTILSQWAKFYTTDKSFLNESQSFYSSIGDLKQDTALINKAHSCWNNIKNESNFCEKYYYVEWDKIKWLNHSSAFLSFLSFYNIASPVLNLLAPLTLLIIPFFMCKLLKIPITFSNYKEALSSALKQHSIGKLFFTFSEVELSQKIYISAMIGLYLYNIYQNIVVCYRFYTNLYVISSHFNILKDYLENTITKINQIQEKTKAYTSYKPFNKYLEDYKILMIEKFEKLSIISNKNISVKNLANMGRIMAQFYDLYTGIETQEIIDFSFQFNGYYDTLCGLSENIELGKLNPATFLTKTKPVLTIKQLYHPSLETKIVKNDITMKKNIILTGPNAAGKTTLLKSVIINLILSQQIGVGYYSKAKISPFDYIHCYINIPDTCSRDSLFQAEARRCKTILENIRNNGNKKHFCIFDELYSGTNPFEAISSAYSYLKYLNKNSNVKFILTTHFTKLCSLLDKHKMITNKHMKTKIIDQTPEYLYKLTKGISKIRGGLVVLQQLDYPEEILEDASDILKLI